MKTAMTAGRPAMLMLLLVVMYGCASTRVTSDWKEASYQEKPDKILVLSMMNDTSQRRLMEDELAGRLRSEGINAVPGYTVLPEGKPDKEAVSEKVRELRADALLLTRIVDRKTVQEYVPGTAYYPPAAYRDWHSYYGGFYPGYPGFAPGGYAPAYTPGYSREVVVNVAEANLYDADTGRIVWSARIESEAQDSDKAAEAYASRIMESLRKQDMIG